MDIHPTWKYIIHICAKIFIYIFSGFAKCQTLLFWFPVENVSCESSIQLPSSTSKASNERRAMHKNTEKYTVFDVTVWWNYSLATALHDESAPKKLWCKKGKHTEIENILPKWQQRVCCAGTFLGVLPNCENDHVHGISKTKKKERKKHTYMINMHFIKIARRTIVLFRVTIY